jgi:hypothetical protein
VSVQIHILDTHALLALPSICSKVEYFPSFLDGLTVMVRDGNLTFPDLVVKECQKYASGEQVYTWINAVSGHRRFKAVEGRWQEAVLGRCEEVLDMDGEIEQAPVLVASMAMMLGDQLSEVYVVTEDRKEVPERRCLAEACKDLGILTISALELAHRANLAHLC